MEACKAFSRQERKYETFSIYVTFFLLHQHFLILNVPFSAKQGAVNTVSPCVCLFWRQSWTQLLVFHTEGTDSFFGKWKLSPATISFVFCAFLGRNILTYLHTGSVKSNRISLVLYVIAFCTFAEKKRSVRSLGYMWQIPTAQRSLSLMSFLSNLIWDRVLRHFSWRFYSYVGWQRVLGFSSLKWENRLTGLLCAGLQGCNIVCSSSFFSFAFLFLLPLLSPLWHLISNQRWVRVLWGKCFQLFTIVLDVIVLETHGSKWNHSLQFYRRY